VTALNTNVLTAEPSLQHSQNDSVSAGAIARWQVLATNASCAKLIRIRSRHYSVGGSAIGQVLAMNDARRLDLGGTVSARSVSMVLGDNAALTAVGVACNLIMYAAT